MTRLKRSEIIEEKMMKMNWKQVTAISILYIVIQMTLVPAIAHNILTSSGSVKLFTDAFIIMNLAVLVAVLFILRHYLAHHWAAFKAQPKAHWISVFKNYGLLIGTSIVVNIILVALNLMPTAANQEVISNQFKLMPFFVFFSAVIMAPIMEEIFFRGVLYIQLRTKHAYLLPILLTTFIFGGVHLLAEFQQGVVWNAALIIRLALTLIPYATMGFFMSRAVEESDSIFGGYFVHLINNAIAILALWLS